jgi:competence protein ComEC
LAQAFRDTGMAHVLAVSGYNIAQVIAAAVTMLAVMNIGRRRAIGWSAAAVLGFTVFVGCGASVVRAALMGVLALVGALLERRYDSGIGLAFAAAVMLLASPLSLRHDLGLRLSFAAVLGLRYLGPQLIGLGVRWLPRIVVKSLAESLAAVIATLPISLNSFGTLALIAPIANLLLAPLVPTAMVLGAIAAAASFAAPPLAAAFGLLPWLLLKALVTVVRVAALVPPVHASIGIFGLTVMYAFIVTVVWRFRPGRSLCR